MDTEAFICLSAFLFDGFTINAPTWPAIVSIVCAVLLLFASGFASGSEIAYFSLSPSDLSEIEEEKYPADKKIQTLLEDKERLLATILISNNAVNVTIILLCNYFFMKVFEFLSPLAEFVIITVILTFLLLLFGEILPKIFAAQKTLSFCRFSASGILFLEKLFHPLASLLVNSTSFLNKYFEPKVHNISVDELSHALELTDKKEIKEESSILKGIIRFGGETAKEVMTPRLDMVTLDNRTSFKDVLKCIVENAYSRIPVYQGTADNIKGILYIKDLLPHLNKSANFRWQTLIRPPYFVPETKKIDDLLREFQENKIHIAIVVDEFGGTSGIVTLEDVLEEIVGEINDEYDEDEKSYVRINSNTFVFEGKTLLSDLYKILKLDDETFDEVEGDADSLAGLLLEIKGDFPGLHEKINFKNFTFEVLEMEERRISKVKIIIHQP